MVVTPQAVADRLHSLDFDVFPLKQDKRPAVRSWKELPDYSELKFTNKNLIGIACGPRSNGLEVIDVDTKVLRSDLGIRSSFEDTFPAVLKDYFLDKFVIDITELVALYRTVSGGFHIVYRSGHLEPNQKLGYPHQELAKDKNNKEALFETRGSGGYVVCYKDNNVKPYLNYGEIDFIGKSLRDALLEFTYSLSIKAEEKITPEPPQKINRPKVEGLDLIDTIKATLTIEEVIRDEFTIYPADSKGNKKVLRHNSTAQSSGSIFSTPGGQILYLHTSNARSGDYPPNKSLDVIALLAIQNGCSYGDILRGYIKQFKSA